VRHPAASAGLDFGYTNQLADGEIIIRTICSRATMVSLIASLLSAYPFALLCAACACRAAVLG